MSKDDLKEFPDGVLRLALILFMGFCDALQKGDKNRMKIIRKALGLKGFYIVKTKEGNYLLKKRKE